MNSNFFAVLYRMRYITRWALMNNTREENISEHSMDVAVVAHALAVIRNRRFGGNIDIGKIVLTALYHDCTEIITGDMPTPVKYSSGTLHNAYAELEEDAAKRLLDLLPEDMKEDYESFIMPHYDPELYKIVKAADRISALVKCIEEEKRGNTEFRKAAEAVRKSIEETSLPEVKVFMEEFLPAYNLTLDELGLS